MKVKVCGITNYDDAIMAIDQGVDALGFNFFPSSLRYIAPEKVQLIIRRLPPFITSVGLFVNVQDHEQVIGIARIAGIQVIQLQGDEDSEYCRKLSAWPLIKAVHIGNSISKEELRSLEAFPVQAFLLDTKDDVLFGGTGRSFDWRLAKHIGGTRPIILAGGLRPENVGAAIRMVQPYAVDICSGVESAPGEKDAAKMKEFMNEVRNASNLL
jgi:phosphoribosylanthranilate isomerase